MGRVRKEETKKECLLIIVVVFYCHVVLFDFGTELGTYSLKRERSSMSDSNLSVKRRTKNQQQQCVTKERVGFNVIVNESSTVASLEQFLPQP